MHIIKSISLWQPHASLVALSEKEFETRSWKCPFHGLIAIHAAKNPATLPLVREEPFASVLRKHKLLKPESLPLGAVLCLAEITGTFPTDQAIGMITTQERAFGDYTPGRYAWQMRVVHVFETPLPCKGMQGIFALPQGLVVRIQQEYAL